MKLTGRWFPQIVQWESISNIYITKIVVLVSEPVRGRSRATELPCFPCYPENIARMRTAKSNFYVSLLVIALLLKHLIISYLGILQI